MCAVIRVPCNRKSLLTDLKEKLNRCHGNPSILLILLLICRKRVKETVGMFLNRAFYLEFEKVSCI